MTKVLVNFIQDRSGSMSSVWTEALSGFRKFVQELKENGKKDGIEYRFSLTTFDTEIGHPISQSAIADVDEGALNPHGPRGMTALYDAVGSVIQNTDEKRDGADKIIVVVVTDGHENSSREWTKERLHAAIDAKLQAGNWTFTYLGTQPETWDEADAIGVGVGASATYDPQNAVAAYCSTAQAVCRLSASPMMASRSLLTDHLTASEARASRMSVSTATHEPRSQPESRPVPSGRKKGTASGRWR